MSRAKPPPTSAYRSWARHRWLPHALEPAARSPIGRAELFGAALDGGHLPSALDLSLHSDLGIVAQRRREFLLQDDAAAHPPRRLPLDRRFASRDQRLPR